LTLQNWKQRSSFLACCCWKRISWFSLSLSFALSYLYSYCTRTVVIDVVTTVTTVPGTVRRCHTVTANKMSSGRVWVNTCQLSWKIQYSTRRGRKRSVPEFSWVESPIDGNGQLQWPNDPKIRILTRYDHSSHFFPFSHARRGRTVTRRIFLVTDDHSLAGTVIPKADPLHKHRQPLLVLTIQSFHEREHRCDLFQTGTSMTRSHAGSAEWPLLNNRHPTGASSIKSVSWDYPYDMEKGFKIFSHNLKFKIPSLNLFADGSFFLELDRFFYSFLTPLASNHKLSRSVHTTSTSI
jgi:hypothetical protein